MLADSLVDVEPGKILIVDDEANIRKGLRAILIKDGHDVMDVGSAEEAIPILETYPCEAAIVDIRMPGMSGVELLAKIRSRWPFISVILLTGHGTLETAITAVKEGAHAYLLKPAQPGEIRQTLAEALVAARRQREQAHLFESLRASLQKMGELPAAGSGATSGVSPRPAEKNRINVGDLTIDLQAHEVRRGDESFSLSPSEFQLLVALASRAGEVIDYVDLVQLSLDYFAEPWEAKELIKRHVFSLRQKIEPEPSSPKYILNVRGVGYRLASLQT